MDAVTRMVGEVEKTGEPWVITRDGEDVAVLVRPDVLSEIREALRKAGE